MLSTLFGGVCLRPRTPVLQDWVFFDRRSLELTMELHPVMRPDPPELLSMWDHNLPALMRFMEMVSASGAACTPNQALAPMHAHPAVL